MALVDYDCSDESGDEDSKNDENPQGIVDNRNGNNMSHNVQATEINDSEGSLFSSLPRPTDKMTLYGNEDKLKDLLLNKGAKGEGLNKKEHVKIMIPSLSDFDNDDTAKPAPKKPKPSPRDTGLFSVLPPPKNVATKEANRKLIPHVISNKMSKPKVDTPLVTGNSANEGESSGTGTFDGDEEDDDNNLTSTSYFGDGISEGNNGAPGVCDGENYNVPSSAESEVFYATEPIPVRPETVNAHEFNVESESVSNVEFVEQKEPTDNGILELDEKALQILCGGKRKRTHMPMNIIDLSGEEIMPDSKEWLLKQLSQERKVKSHSHRKHEGPSIQQRRKHQITYLAFQAKEQELELQNQWSNNRMSRKQTQSKYGF